MLRQLALAALTLLVCGCASTGAYRAQTAESADGYSERRLDEAHWRIEYVGEASASQDRVESFLLYRAAELTVTSGYDWFMPAEHVLEEETEVVVEVSRGLEPSPVWRPMWRHRKRFFWSDWMPAGAEPPPDSPQPAPTGARTITRFAAREDITMGRGAAPAGAFNAREVMALLAPTVAGD
ncbi:MAG: hypothetical protein AB7O98_06665 [Hyphomonadaceae bacterium]